MNMIYAILSCSMYSFPLQRIPPFRDLIASTLSRLNPNMSHDVFEQAADGIVEFESKLAQVCIEGGDQ